jgi:tetratricopeptide (TPR) repeat protein
VRDSEMLLGAVPGFGFARGAGVVDIVPRSARERRRSKSSLPPPLESEPPPVESAPPPAVRPAAPVLAAPAPEAEPPPQPEVAEPPPLEVAEPEPSPPEPDAAAPSPPGPSPAAPEVEVEVTDEVDLGEEHDEVEVEFELPPEAEPAPSPAPPPPSKPPPASEHLPRVMLAAPLEVEAVHTPSTPPPAGPSVASPSRPPPPTTLRSTPPPAPAAAPPAPSARPSTPRPGPASAAIPVAEHLAAADALSAKGAQDDALAELKKALAAGTATPIERAEIYVRSGAAKRAQGKVREAISNYEKALQIVPAHRGALEAVVELCAEERDGRALAAAEERLLAAEKDAAARFELLRAQAKRWEDAAHDVARARARLEAALELRPDDAGVLDELRRLCEATGARDLALGYRRRAALATPGTRERAERFVSLGKHLLFDLEREEEGLATLELALETDPGALESLELIARVLADRQEWSELEKAYRRMLGRTGRLPKGAARAEVTWELCRRLGLLLRDHLDDPELALDAFADSLAEKPDDLGGHLVAADLARATNQLDRALGHLQAAAALDPTRVETFHALFELYQRTRRPDQAYCAASVATHLHAAEPRERFVYEEHRPEGLPKLDRPLRDEAWDLLEVPDRDRNVEAIFAAVAPAAIAARVARLEAEGRLPVLDPATRQDPHTSTVSIVRSFAWASHLLGVPAPPLYLREDAPIALAALAGGTPAVIAGGGVLRGRSLPELAFLAGRQLAYFAGEHRLLLYYPSMDDLAACFLAAIAIASPNAPAPARLEAEVGALRARLEASLADHQLDRLVQAVTDLEQAGGRADLSRWAAAVERCATRAGFAVCGDLDVAAAILRAEPRAVLDPEAKVDDLLGYAVSDAYHDLRVALGIGIEP